MPERKISGPADALDEIRQLYNHAPCGLHSLDKDDVFVRVNDTELRWLGYERDELIGRMKISDLLACNSIRTAEDHFARFKSQGSVLDIELRLVRKDGSILPVLLSATAIRDLQGRYVMSRSVITELERTAADVPALKRAAAERERLIGELQEALARVKLLSGLLPICAGCKKIRDEQGSWQQMEIYIRAHSEASFSHGMCPECAEQFGWTAHEHAYPEAERMQAAHSGRQA